MVIIVKSKTDGREVVQLQLPQICFTHMSAMTPQQNLAMLMKHVNNGIKPLTCSRIFLRGEECAGIKTEDVSSDSTVLEIDF